MMERAVTARLLTILSGLLLATPAVAADEQPRYGGTFIYALDSNPETLNPAITTGKMPLVVGCKVYSGLIYLDRDLNPRPDLADAWTVAPDGLTYTFRLHRDVRWHDGKPFTSADVKFSFEQVLARYHPRTRVAFQSVSAIETPDPHTVIVRFKKPYASFLNQMNCLEGAILPRHLYEGTDVLKNPRNTDHPIGTGPFRWAQWARGSHLTLVRNPDYFRKGLPYLDRVVAKVLPDASARVLALEAGEVDYIQSYVLPKEDVARLRKDPRFQVVSEADAPGNFLLFYNTRRRILEDKRVRHALLMALDRDLMVTQVLFGLASVGRSAVHVGLKWAYSPDVDYTKLYPYDPARSNRLLDEAGYRRGRDGVRFDLKLIYHATGAALPALAEIARNNWKDVGARVTLEPVERQVYIEKVYGKQDFDVNIHPITTAGDPAMGIARFYETTKDVRPFTNPTGYSNPRLDQLFDRGAQAPDRAERARYYREAQKVIAEDLPTANLIDRQEIDVASAKFRGIWKSLFAFSLWDEVWWTGGAPAPR